MSLTSTLDREAIIASSASLPAAPQIMARLYKLLLDFNAGLRSIADLLKRDPALTARVIRIANSPAYGAGGVGTIEDALQRVGFSEVYRLVGSASNSSIGEKGLSCYGFSADDYRRHNLFSALVAEQLAIITKMDARAAYTAGLLRGIGQLLLDGVGRTSLSPSEGFVQCGAGRAVEWERRFFGVTHYEVAGILLAEWGFPEEIVDAVRHAHSEAGEISRLSKLIDITDNIVRIAGFGLTADEAEWGVPQEKLEALGIKHDDVERVQTEAMSKLEALESAQKS
ncbi:MAG: HDOD domain-containing protein [Verrucomicrobia bacterium]|nr:HDOD domain-containing protein [Verrucomicrobiota bacterium]